jgi:site-specific recombinase XerD
MKLNLETVLVSLQRQEIHIYELLDNFVSYLLKQNLSMPSIILYVSEVKSYFAYYDIDVIPSKFKHKVKMPKHYRENEQPIDVQDIRSLLLKCNNRRSNPLWVRKWFKEILFEIINQESRNEIRDNITYIGRIVLRIGGSHMQK